MDEKLNSQFLQAQKFSKFSKLLSVSSSDQFYPESTDNSDFIVYQKEKTLTQRIKYIQSRDIIVPNVFYNIRSSNGTPNNVLALLQTGQSQALAVVPEGQYTIATFIPALQTAINAVLVGETVTITQSALTGLLTFVFSGVAVTLYDIQYNLPLTSPPSPSGPSSMANAVGILSTVTGTTITAQSLPDLSGVKMAYVHSVSLSEASSIDAAAGIINMIDCVSLTNTPFGGYAYKQNNDSELAQITYSKNTDISSFNITLRDENGKHLNIGTAQLTIILKIYYD